MEKIGLKIVDLLHDLTQLEYRVYFSNDFDGMVTVGIEGEYFDTGVYTHYHCGYPECPRERLEEDILKSLSCFLDKVKESENAQK